ncbi:MAG: OprO/OprP family phosphate-selective porin [Gammaproteobacteria bacterium]
MNLSKLTLAVATVLGAGASSSAFAIDLYVDVKTKQIYAEPGKNRQLMGSFVQVDEAAAMAASKPAESAELAAVKEDLELKTNEIKSLQEHMTEAEKVKMKLDKKGLQAESADGNFKFRLGGRIHADASYSSNDNYLGTYTDSSGIKQFGHVEANDGTEIRRARMEFLGTFFKDWDFKSQVDFADNKVAVKDMFVQYTGLEELTKGLGLNVTFGQQKQAFSRELQESSNDMMFMERSVMNILNEPTVDRAIGLNLASLNKDWTGQVGIYGDTVDPNSQLHDADEGWAVNSRWTWAPLNEKTHLVHLGIAGNYRVPDAKDNVNDKGFKYSYETSHMSNLKVIDKSVHDIDSIKMLGLEANYLYGPFTVGGEYTHQWIDRKDGAQNIAANGWYGEASYTLTGESRKYKHGKFYHVDPAKPFSISNGGWGAWELAMRYGEADLDDGDFKGGQISNLTVALNWYFNSNLRLMADYNRILDIDNAAVVQTNGSQPDNLDTFMLRGQLYF